MFKKKLDLKIDFKKSKNSKKYTHQGKKKSMIFVYFFTVIVRNA